MTTMDMVYITRFTIRDTVTTPVGIPSLHIKYAEAG